jgi:hypothetical protein
VYELPHFEVASIVSLVDVNEFVVKQATGKKVVPPAKSAKRR